MWKLGISNSDTATGDKVIIADRPSCIYRLSCKCLAHKPFRFIYVDCANFTACPATFYRLASHMEQKPTE